MSEHLAKKFHDTYERLSVEYGWKTQEQCQVEFADLPEENRELMIAVVSEVCADLLTDSKRLDKLLSYLRKTLDKFESDPIERALWKDYERGYADCLRDTLKNREEPHE